jgi:hypothetical protein
MTIKTFDVPTALRFAAYGNLEAWILAYLTYESPNSGLVYHLQDNPHWWRGPLQLPLTSLTRCCGPERGMKYPTSWAEWEYTIPKLAAGLTDLQALPPLIVEYQAGQYLIHDGNHRYEAIRRKRWPMAWVVIWYNSEADYAADEINS